MITANRKTRLLFAIYADVKETPRPQQRAYSQIKTYIRKKDDIGALTILIFHYHTLSWGHEKVSALQDLSFNTEA